MDDLLIQTLYEGILCDDALQTALGSLARINPDVYLALLHMKKDGSAVDVALSFNLEDWHRRLYEEYYHSVDPSWALISAIKRDRVVSITDILDEKELVKSEYYNDYLRPINKAQSWHMVNVGSATMIGGLTFGVAINQRERVTEKVVSELERLRPHLQQVMRLRLLRHQHDYRERLRVVHGMAVATAVLTTSGSVVEVNEKAEALFNDRPDGARSGMSLEELGRATRAFVASARPTAQLNLPDRLGRPAYFARLVSFRAEGTRLSSIEREYAGVPGQLVLAFIGVIGSVDPGIVRPLAESLGLTPAETDLVELLVNGSTIAEAAERLGRARSTARNQLASAMGKADVRRQVDLVRLFAQSGPV